MMVPTRPSRASVMRSSAVMMLRWPPLRTNRQRRLDLGPHRAGGEVALRGILLHLAEGDLPDGARRRAAVAETAFSTSVAITSASASTERARTAAVRSLSMTASIPRTLPSSVADHGDAAAAGRHDDVAGVHEGEQGVGVEDLERLGRGDDASPALLAAVLPGLAVLDEQLRPGRRAGTGRWAWSGWVNPGSWASTRVRVTSAAHRRSTPRAASDHSSVSRMVKPMVACVWAPHQSSGTGGTTCAASSFLTSRLPTWGPLPCVSTTSMAGRDEARDVLHRAADRVALLLGRGTAVGAGHGIAAERDEDPHAHLHWSRA